MKAHELSRDEKKEFTKVKMKRFRLNDLDDSQLRMKNKQQGFI